MTEPSAVQQAVDLLTARLAEARQRRDALTAEIATIEDAITGLAVFANGARTPPPTLGVILSADRAQSVRAAVKSIIDSEDRAFTPAEVRNLIPAAVMDGKSSQQRTNSVRTAMWSLRKKGEAALIDDVRTKSTKWSTPESSPPDLPAENGSGTFAFTKAQT